MLLAEAADELDEGKCSTDFAGGRCGIMGLRNDDDEDEEVSV